VEQNLSNSCAGRVVVVTGGAQGLGLAYSERLAAAGARVAIADIDDEAIANLTDCAGITAVRADVTDPGDVERLVALTTSEVGPIDALINNAGGALIPRRDFETMDLAEWRRVLDVNLTSQWICSSAVVPAMKAVGRGKIINVASTVVGRGSPAGMVPYIAAKGGVIGFTRALAHELGPHGITVNAIAPGFTPVATPKTVHAADQVRELTARMIAEQCLERTGTPDDLCGVVEFLVSPASDFMTGQVLNVDGGWVMS
jgi:3-oxoacyl-[acyl-carrier protein] reductase